MGILLLKYLTELEVSSLYCTSGMLVIGGGGYGLTSLLIKSQDCNLRYSKGAQ
jgi:hypothetical protein